MRRSLSSVHLLGDGGFTNRAICGTAEPSSEQLRQRFVLAALLTTVLTACPSSGAAVVVDTSTHAMALCRDGQSDHRYDVAIGSGGPAPKRVGWAQTPLGRFTLAPPRESSSYHLFVPLVNPDPKRFSAWAIGIHGPPRVNKDDGHSNVETDWTLGCIAVSSDLEIDEVAAWIRALKVTRVEFR
jgi:hypothetical protein